MILLNGGFLINEELIKCAVPYSETPKTGMPQDFPKYGVRITFTDGDEKVFMGIDPQQIYKVINEKERK